MFQILTGSFICMALASQVSAISRTHRVRGQSDFVFAEVIVSLPG
jgi:hypothetical protein